MINRWVIGAIIVVLLAFSGAFALGVATKKRTVRPSAPQLAPTTSVRGQHVQITRIKPAATIPGLKPKPTTGATTSGTTTTGATTTGATTTGATTTGTTITGGA